MWFNQPKSPGPRRGGTKLKNNHCDGKNSPYTHLDCGEEDPVGLIERIIRPEAVRDVLEPLPGLHKPDLPVDAPPFCLGLEAVEERQRAGQEVAVRLRVAVEQGDKGGFQGCGGRHERRFWGNKWQKPGRQASEQARELVTES